MPSASAPLGRSRLGTLFIFAFDWRSVLERFEGIQMVNVHLPTTDGKELLLPRYTQPDKDQILLLSKLRLHLRSQPKPELLDNRPGMGQLVMHV